MNPTTYMLRVILRYIVYCYIKRIELQNTYRQLPNKYGYVIPLTKLKCSNKVVHVTLISVSELSLCLVYSCNTVYVCVLLQNMSNVLDFMMQYSIHYSLHISQVCV